LDIDEQTFIPQVSMFTSRVVRRLLWPRIVAEFNNYILGTAENYQPDIFLAFKGAYVHAKTLGSLSCRGIKLYNYFPDTSAFNHGKWLPRSLAEYDCVFYTKPFWYADVTKRIPLKGGYFLPHGYDPFLHRPVELDSRDISDYGCDVSFIAFHSRYKEMLLKKLIGLRPDLNLCVWGDGWTARCESTDLRRRIKGFALYGDRYARGIQAARINLAIMNGPIHGASSGDLTTSRTYAIPASGGFMLHQRNSEVLDLYKEDEEIACFDSVEELAEKIDFYLTHQEEREQVARCGHSRCVPAYSYDNRMAELLHWHYERLGANPVSAPSLHCSA
jgi:glycosyltransferase involved in cell wall biosynthesis